MLKSHEAKTVLAPFELLISRNAMNVAYRTIEIGISSFRACCSYGILEVFMTSLTGVNTILHVDNESFLAVVNSLPANDDLHLSNDDTTLIWSCGSARGRLALVTMNVDDIPAISLDGLEGCSIPDGFASSLELGALSCDSAALSAIGMFGIVVDQRHGLVVCSTDNISVSTSSVAGTLPGASATCTLPPNGAALLAAIIKPDGALAFDDSAWYYWDKDGATTCKIMIAPPMKTDIQAVCSKFVQKKLVAPVQPARLDVFIKRAAALSEIKRNATVGLSVAKGRLLLCFREGASTTDEYFEIAQLANLPEMKEITLSAGKTARALSHVTEVVLDYSDRGILLFRGNRFNYLLSGKIETQSEVI